MPSARARSQARAATRRSELLALQRRVGNRAVDGLLATQRQPADTVAAPAALPPAIASWTARMRELGILEQDDAALLAEASVAEPAREHADAPAGKSGNQARSRAAARLREAVHAVVGERVTELTAGLPSEVRRQIDETGPKGVPLVARRTAFLVNLSRYMPGGTVNDLLTYYGGIVPVAIPGFSAKHHHLHRDAHARLLLVAAEMARFGMKMPIFGNGFSMRGRHLDADVSLGMMSHPLGTAMDFQAARMSHIYRNARKGPEGPYVAELRDLVTGGAGGQFVFPRLGRGRRAAIIEVGKAMASGGELTPELAAKARDLIRDYDANYERVRKGSRALETSGIGAKLAPFGDEVRALVAERKTLTKGIARLDRVVARLDTKRLRRRDGELSPRDAKKLQAADRELSDLNERFAEVERRLIHIKHEANLPEIFKPHLDRIAATKPEAERHHSELAAKIEALENAIVRARRERIAAAEEWNATASQRQRRFPLGELALRRAATERKTAVRLKKRLSRRIERAKEGELGGLWVQHDALDALIEALQSETDALRAGSTKAAKELRDAAHTAKWKVKRLEGLAQRLTDDEVFIWGERSHRKGSGWKRVNDPSMQQLHELGFFNPQDRPSGESSTKAFLGATVDRRAGGSQPRGIFGTLRRVLDAAGFTPSGKATSGEATKAEGSSSEGFNQTFMRLMHLYGFEQLVTGEGSQDSMHFDFRETLATMNPPTKGR